MLPPSVSHLRDFFYRLYHLAFLYMLIQFTPIVIATPETPQTETEAPVAATTEAAAEPAVADRKSIF
jgi:hypothetical protein